MQTGKKFSFFFSLLILSLSIISISVFKCGTGGKPASPDDGVVDEDGIPPPCVDEDGDGYGHGCDKGGDCDDSDPDHWKDCDDCRINHQEGCSCEAGESYFCYEGPASTEGVGQCHRGIRNCINGQLGPCEGQVLPDRVEKCDDGIDNDCNGYVDEQWICGDCIPPCYTEGEVEPSPSDPGATGLIPNPDGPGVILGSGEEEGGFAWIANAGEGTVSKLDVKTGMEVGRYRVGKTGTANDSPSRTAVDDYQNAYVANRAFHAQGSVTKIAGFERYCTDKNGNGEIDTSHGSEPLPLGEDECVLWTKDVGGTDGIPRALVIDFGSLDRRGGFPWVGCWREMKFYKLDPADGTILEEVNVDVHPYGATIDSSGWIWISGRSSGAIQRFHYATLTVEPPVSIPSSICRGGEPYGITMDKDDRVWVGVWSEGGACRYDPETGNWFFVETGGRGRGIAVDADNIIWVSNDNNGRLYRFNAIDGGGVESFSVPGSTPIGVGADKLGRIWTINHGSNNAARFDKSTSSFETFAVGTQPYTYSDFLGLQRWIVMPIGIWIRVFERCADKPDDKWMEIVWDTQTPSDSHITIIARSADTMGEILSAPEVTLASIGPDPDSGSKNIEEVYAAEGHETGKYIEITVILEPGTIEAVSPVFKSLQLYYYCSDFG